MALLYLIFDMNPWWRKQFFIHHSQDLIHQKLQKRSVQRSWTLLDCLRQRCKSRRCCRSKTSAGAAVVYYRKPAVTRDTWYTRIARRVKNMPILSKCWNSLGVDSRYLLQIYLKLYVLPFKPPWHVFYATRGLTGALKERPLHPTQCPNVTAPIPLINGKK